MIKRKVNNLAKYIETSTSLTVKEIRLYSLLACEKGWLDKIDLLDIQKALNMGGIGIIAGFHRLKVRAEENSI